MNPEQIKNAIRKLNWCSFAVIWFLMFFNLGQRTLIYLLHATQVNPLARCRRLPSEAANSCSRIKEMHPLSYRFPNYQLSLPTFQPFNSPKGIELMSEM
jgi:hypothetical protein